MPQDKALVAAAVGLARQSAPQTLNESVSAARRPRSACSSSSEPATSVSTAVLTGNTPQPQSATADADCSCTPANARTVAGVKVVDEGTIQQFFLQGVAVPAQASEQEQYPHFFEWINMQKRRHTQDSNQTQHSVQHCNSRPMSSCSSHRAASAGRQEALLHGNGRPISASTAARSACQSAGTWSGITAHRSRPFSATVGHRQQQDQGTASATTRPSSASAWIPKRPASPSSGGQQQNQQQGQSTTTSRLVPGWLLERCASKPVIHEQCSRTAAVPIPSSGEPVEPSNNTPTHSGPNGHPWGWFPDGSGRDSSLTLGSSRPASPATTAGNLKQCQHHQIDQSQHAAQQLFQQLPLKPGATVDRQTLRLLSLGLQYELRRLGPPVSLQLPPGTSISDEAAWSEPWSAQQQVASEVQVWDKLVAELCRQTYTACSQRGSLLLTAVSRQRQLLHMALSACDNMYCRMQSAAGELQQVQNTVLALQTDLQTSQQQNAHLMASLESKQLKLDSLTRQLCQQQDKMRQGRFHLIAEEVEAAKKGIEARWLQLLEDQLHTARQQAAELEAASRKQWQLQVLQAVAEVADDSVADSVMRRLNGDEAAGVGESVAEDEAHCKSVPVGP